MQDGEIVLEDVARRVVRDDVAARKTLVVDDILVTKSSGSATLVGKCAMVRRPFDEPHLFSNFTLRLRVNSEVATPELVFLYLVSPTAKAVLADIHNTTTGLRNLAVDCYLGQLVPVPPLEEQRRIAARLSEQMAKVERMRRSAEAQVEAARALPAAFVRQVLESEEAKTWPTKRLGDICDIVGGGSLPSVTEGVSGERAYCLKVSDLDGPRSDGRWLSGGAQSTSRTAVAGGLLRPNAIVFPKRGGAIATNKKRILTVHAILDPNLMGIQVKDREETFAPYLYWWLESQDLSSIQSGTTVPQINRGDLFPLLVPLPSIDDQKRIASALAQRIDEAGKACRIAESQLEAAEALRAALLEEVFGGFEAPTQEAMTG